uniref:Uncharacterized protein n=1 Tax=uncultured crenarchaeote MCG TaxID=529375 RepID=B2YI73_9CREN|nr:hypothetical protein [uncultured crenarchaeote MCG]
MVNASRVKKKLPSLLVDGETTNPKHWNSHNKIAYRMQRLRRKNRAKYDYLNVKLVAVLKEYLEALFAD